MKEINIKVNESGHLNVKANDMNTYELIGVLHATIDLLNRHQAQPKQPEEANKE